MRAPSAVLTIALLSCSSGGGSGRKRPVAVEPAAPAPGAPASEPAPVTPRECELLIDRALALHGTALARALPADQLPTEAERQALRGDLVAKFLPECLAGTRPAYDCAMAAPTLEALGACGEGSSRAGEPR